MREGALPRERRKADSRCANALAATKANWGLVMLGTT